MKNEWSQSLVEMAHLFGSIGALDCFFIFYRLHFRILRNFLIQNEWLRSKSDLYVGVFDLYVGVFDLYVGVFNLHVGVFDLYVGVFDLCVGFVAKLLGS